MFTRSHDTWQVPPILKIRGCMVENGRRRLFPAAVERYLSGEGAAVAAVLGSDAALSLEDIQAVFNQKQYEQQSLAATTVAMIVLRLVTMGAAELIAEPICHEGG